jgi:hypothetical protein
MTQNQKFSVKPPSRLEAIAHHADEKEGDCDHQRGSCSDSGTAATPADGVFGSDRGLRILGESGYTSHGTDVYRRTLATCYLAGKDLNGWLVQQGWALAYVKYSSAYRQVEEDARVNQRGIWQGAFIAPWDWRHRNDKTVILGALSVPIDAQKVLLAPSATEGAPSPECTIKGVISRNGERIYHTEHQNSYARIRMDKGGGRRWFCTPEEAEAAGWRRALR